MAESKHCGILQHEKSFSNHQSDNLYYSASVSREALKDVVWRGQCINRTACLSEGLTSIEMEHSLSCAFLCFYFELYSYLPTFVTLWGFFLDKMLVDSVNMHCISPVQCLIYATLCSSALLFESNINLLPQRICKSYRLIFQENTSGRVYSSDEEQ